MGLNKVKPGSNMYQFITHTWNPLGGECLHNCGYCSTKKFHWPVLIEKYSGPPKLMEHELKTNLGSGKFIFVVAQNDLFAEGIPEKWIKSILDHCSKFNNSYLFQTKNPGRIHHFTLPKNSVICTTIETNKWYSEYMGNALNTHYRAIYMDLLSGIDKYVTIEPIMDFDLKEMVDLISLCNPIRVNIGANSGGNNLPEPSKEQILELIFELKKFTEVKLKSNLNRLIK